ncbi:class I SAM-dependent methyltransferase [Pseudonocardia bannensis]|uniref:Methyltransferase domain-containing protein n=1 Tax=Pseudonocardia bannensis TaxID=630973 RepID=A0A848DEM9_9PSEU|nr:methyltransferase domain-containing protein [Pseudonocardia bannensis]NMH91025.1 methyltransferase domain-containing protein [Pseudonocardia bannensis]
MTADGSNRYTHGHHDSVLRSHRRRTAENSAGYLLPHLRPGMDLLDVGCGPGTITVDLARRVAPGRVLGIDAAAAPLDEARAAARGMANVAFAQEDLYRLDGLETSFGGFDVVHAHQVLQHVSDPVAALARMRRVVRPGGLVAARDADYAAMTWFPHDERLDAWLDVYRRVARGNDAEPDAGRALLAWARAAGFTQVTPSASVWCYATPDERAWWGGMWADRIRSSAVAEQAVDRGLATRDDLAAMSAAWREWAAHPDGWFTVLNGEILARG